VLLDCWQAGDELLLDEWDVSIECVSGWSPTGGAALLSTYWTDMPCGCVFGALQVVHLDAVDSGQA
jgi:hypothetical protein